MKCIFSQAPKTFIALNSLGDELTIVKKGVIGGGGRKMARTEPIQPPAPTAKQLSTLLPPNKLRY